MSGFQLWANLPADQKMMAPRVSRGQGGTDPGGDAGRMASEVRVVSGRVGDTQGPVRDIVTDPVYLDVIVPPRSEHLHPTPRTIRSSPT